MGGCDVHFHKELNIKPYAIHEQKTKDEEYNMCMWANLMKYLLNIWHG